ncbi:asparagine synthetase B family protein [Lacimicrobium alkaliphilum]|uniref:asparagine synthase (glutamine-hydrolyzing) n=1 Tax=Lacimicrobium alkaliphilum TaxID=1526571 RepID=A0ABQ1RQI2_9ALTE|nr:asparagine synthase-related protein [Lacimicrobium alkaliphilum]GGD75326.1 asparagine synthetase B [Lacimicrobium alkaliphilum]
MWKLESSSEPAQNHTASQRIEVTRTGDKACKLTLVAEHGLSVAENDQHLVCVLGRLRPYNQDYGLKQPAQWLLECLAEKGADFYAEIAGFFALVILDKQTGALRLVTDHVGSVPVYLAQHAEQYWVTDSLKLIEPELEDESLELNPQALFNYCFYHCIPASRSIYRSAQKLKPGTELCVQASGEMQESNLYQPAYNYSDQSTEALMAQCREVIELAVKRNIAPKSAAFLSGGLDSSTVAGMFAKHQPGAPTISIGFDAKGYDETEYAKITAEKFKTNHQVHYLQPQEIVDNFVEVAGYYDEPFGNSSAMAAYICAKVAKESGTEVMLAGDGGDELFGGNERYAKQKVFEAYSQVPGVVQKPLEMLLNTPLGKLPVLKKGLSYVDQANIPLPDRMDTYNFLNRFDLKTMFREDFLASIDTEEPAKAKRDRYQQCRCDDAVEQMMYLDWKFTLADNDLVKVSRMCRKAGVEVRYPLLEKEVVDFSCTVPASVKLPGNRLRDFYKNTFRGFLADETLSKSKHGFGLPFGVWMKEQPTLQKITNDSLKRLRERQIFRPEFIDTALSTYQSGHANYYGELIWIMVVLELWLTSRGL